MLALDGRGRQEGPDRGADRDPDRADHQRLALEDVEEGVAGLMADAGGGVADPADASLPVSRRSWAIRRARSPASCSPSPTTDRAEARASEAPCAMSVADPTAEPTADLTADPPPDSPTDSPPSVSDRDVSSKRYRPKFPVSVPG